VEWVFVGIAVVVLFGVYLSWTAGRLDRLHARVDAARAVLDAQLFRRSGAALDVASGGLLDPASAMLVADAASRARTADPKRAEKATTGLSGFREEPGTGLGSQREQAESDLTEALAETLADAVYVARLREEEGAGAALDELAAACRQVGHARRFHNDTVRAARRLRRKNMVRWLRLAGHAPWPETVEFDDAVPQGLGG
jgi:NTP pyrophosphatase (non-canonical NTP hydrolase)